MTERGIFTGECFWGWQVYVFVHENYATSGDPVTPETAKPQL